MSLDFVQNFEATGRRIQWRQWTAAACWVLAGVAASALLLMAADRWFGVYHPAARAILTAQLVVAATSIWRRAAKRVGDRKSPLQVALLLEQDEPELQSLLSSGVEFTSQDPADVTAGSVELRRGVVLRAALASERVDLLAAAARRAPVGKAVAAAAIAMAAVGAATAWAPHSVAIGVARLVNPFSPAEWPRRHELAFVDPPRLLAVGGDFRVKLQDRRGALPTDVVVEYRQQRQGRWHYDSQRYASGGPSLEVVWPNVQGPFEFRARGGDHRTMPWRRVATATAPQVEALHITMHAPAYAGWPAKVFDEPFRVLQGSTLELVAQTTEPVESARLEAKGQSAIPLVVGGRGRSISLAAGEWRPAVTAEWSFQLTTADGLTIRGARPMGVEVMPDIAPSVAIVEPTDELSLLPSAQIDLTVEASDDVGLSEVVLAVQELDAPTAPPRVIETELFRATSPGVDRETVSPTVVHHLLALATIDAKPGSTWEVRAAARDLAGQESRSQPPLRLRVISFEQFITRVERELARVRAAVANAYDHQRDALSRVEAWSSDGGAIHWPVRDQGLAALAQQRQTAQPLSGGQDAAISVLEALLADYRRNGLLADDDLPRLERLHAALDALTRESLPAVENLLEQFVRELELVDWESVDTSEEARLLADIAPSQSESLAVLEAALAELSLWSEVQPYRREIAALKAEQAAVLAETQADARTALQNTAQPSNSTARNRRTTAVVAAQRELAARLANVLSRMQQSFATLAAEKSADSARLAAALEAAETSAVQITAFSAVDHLAAARLGQATDAQRDVGRGLQEILDRLAGGDTRDAARRLAELKEVEQRVEALRQQAQTLAAKQKVAERAGEAQKSELQRLAQERKSLAESTERLAQQLNQLNVAQAASAARRAQQNLAKFGPSSKTDRRAANELQQAKQALAGEQRQQQALLAQLQMQRLESALQSLVSDQQQVVDDLSPAGGTQTDDKSFKPGSTADIAEVAKHQAAVRRRTQREAERLDAVPVFARSLRAASDFMGEVEKELTADNAGDRAAQSATRALDQLKLLADAVRQQQQNHSPSAPPPGQSPPRSGNSQQNQAKNAAQARMLQLAIAQLTILRKMQADVEARTAELENSFAAGNLDAADLTAQSARLAAEQRELAELAASVVRDAELPPIDEESESQ